MPFSRSAPSRELAAAPGMAVSQGSARGTGVKSAMTGLSPRAARAPDGTAVLSAATGMTVFPDDFLRPRAAPAAGHRLMESGSTAILGAPAPEMPRLSLRVSTGPRAAPGPEAQRLAAGRAFPTVQESPQSGAPPAADMAHRLASATREAGRSAATGQWTPTTAAAIPT